LVVHEDAHVQARISLKKIAMGTVTVRVSEKVKEALVCVSANSALRAEPKRAEAERAVSLLCQIDAAERGFSVAFPSVSVC